MSLSNWFTVSPPCYGPVRVELAGEIDITYMDALQTFLKAVSESARLLVVDLSRTTFLDARCLREIVVHYQLHAGRLALCKPSPEVELSVAACDLEEWIHFHPDEQSALRRLYEGCIQTALRPGPFQMLPEEGGGHYGL